MKHSPLYAGLLALLTLNSCTYEEFEDPNRNTGEKSRICLAGQISQEYTTRANDEGFADGDVMGVYIVDYTGNNPGKLLSKGNRGDNVRHTFNESSYSWSSAYDLYWKDKHTRIDVYGYYPYDSPEDVNNFQFTVKTNQAKTYDNGSMGDYEASDFLWGKVEGVEPTSNVIRLPLTHRMANVRVTLIEGSGFAEGEWADTRKQILVTNTANECVIDLETGTLSPTGGISPNSIIPFKRGDEWRAIVVPQTIPAGTTMFSITIDGIPYKFSKNEEFTYVSGKMSNFGIRVDKKEASGQYTLTIISESITPWENDLVSHDATAKEYVVINSTPGGLKNAIKAANLDHSNIKNLKITGKIDSRDFYFMRDEMARLQALNLKEVMIVKDPTGDNKDDEIPYQAFCDHNLTRIVLPDRLTSIGAGAFAHCGNLTGSLDIPEGIVTIEGDAFACCSSLNGTLTLPSSLKAIKHYAFNECGFTCELQLPDNLEEIGYRAFYECRNLYGELRLPYKLKKLGSECFFHCHNFSGDLEIPQGVTEIPNRAFCATGFDGALILHDGIISIAEYAFSGAPLKGELILPKDLTTIKAYAFDGCDFSGNLVFPKSIINIEDGAFRYNSRLSGIISFPEGLIRIGSLAFDECRGIEGLVFPESLENIYSGAFRYCFGIGSIVCNGSMPPYIQDEAFEGVAKDNFTLEVPESAVAQYQTASGWRDFKRIAAHHELVCRPSTTCALGTKREQTLVIDAEGEWEVASKPDWCSLSQNSGNKKTEITLTINAYSGNSGSREGDVVFRLKDKDYTHKCHVTQYGYEHGEDEYLTLQSATKGNNGGINIVIVGDGYDAREIADGSYLKDMRQEIEYFFGIEPYTTYRDYFNVYTAFPVSTESGVGTLNTIRYNRFNTTYTVGVGLKCDYDELFSYVLKAPTVNSGNIDRTLIIVVPNSSDYGGICQMWESGAAIAFCPKSNYGYPLDSRGVLQHEAGGHGFGKLGDEYIYHNAFIQDCSCTDCAHDNHIRICKSRGWYDNLELTGKTHEVGWSHLIFDPRYSDIVDIFEGGYMHSRGVFRSEQNSCMNNNIPYYSTISRESIVKRIKRYAGEAYSFEDFVAKDKRGVAQAQATRGVSYTTHNAREKSFSPVIHKGSPLSSKNKNKKGLSKRSYKR